MGSTTWARESSITRISTSSNARGRSMRAVSYENPRAMSSRLSARQSSAYRPPRLGSKAGRKSARRATQPPRGGTPGRAARPRRTKVVMWPAAASGRSRPRTGERPRGGPPRLGRATRGLPAAKEEKGVEPAPGSRLRVEEEAHSVLDGGLVPGGCRLGTLVETKDVAGSGDRAHDRFHSGNGGTRSGRASIAPTRLSETTRLPGTVRPPLLPATGGTSGRAGDSSRRSVAPGVLTVLFCGPAS